MHIWKYELGTTTVVLLIYFTVTLTLFLLSFVLPSQSSVQRHSSFFARTLASIAGLIIAASYGVVASIVLKTVGLAGLSQWTCGRCFKWTMWWFTGVWFEVVEGEEYLLERPAVFVGNHQSELDVLMLGAVFPKWCSVTAKSSLKWMPFLGWFMALSNTVFIDRKNRATAMKAFEGAANHMRTQRQSVYIFAEGTRSYYEKPGLLPFKKGAFHLAVQAQVPIVPIVVANYSNVLNIKRRVFRAGRIPIKVLPPVSTKGLAVDDVNQLCHDTREIMLKTLVELTESEKEQSRSTTVADGFSTGVDVGKKPVANSS